MDGIARGDWTDAVAVATILALPVLVAALSRARGRQDAGAFTINRGRNGMVATVAGVIAGNVGIGGFVAMFLFTQASPVVGMSVAIAYTLGLVACAVLAPRIRRRAHQAGTIGLADLLAKGGSARSAALVWLPLAVVFVLRSAVQVGALGVIVAATFGIGAAQAVLASVALLGTYLVIGGYRAAVETDIVQASIIVVGVAIAAIGMVGLATDGTARPLTLGPYEPVFLLGIWLFLPWSALLAVDNWQRITVARSDSVARRGYLVAALIFGVLFAVLALAGHRAAPGADMMASFRALMPGGMGWIASAMFVACIMSSVDTFIMPLAASMRRLGPGEGPRDIGRLRLVIVALLAATAATAVAFGDVLANVVAAFNSLTVFLPAAFGALFLDRPSPRAAAVSMVVGLVSALGFTMVDEAAAALVGFVLASIGYAVTYRVERSAGDAGGSVAPQMPERPSEPI